MLNDVLSSTQWKPFCFSKIVFIPLDPDIAPDFPDGCSGSAVRNWKPRRLRHEGAVEVAIMISDTPGLYMIRSAAARPRGAKSAIGALGAWHQPAVAGTRHLACTSWSLVDCKQVLSLDSWNTRTTSIQTIQKKQKLGQSRNQVQKKLSCKSKNPQVGVLPGRKRQTGPAVPMCQSDCFPNRLCLISCIVLRVPLWCSAVTSAQRPTLSTRSPRSWTS